MKNIGIRGRITLLIIIAALPALGLIAYPACGGMANPGRRAARWTKRFNEARGN
ncbi:MAG: hypothetical protein K2X06_00395 [Burkholderiales bacterium]|nr:hypothetical protein [Burkholderiales bacterium]